jgi:hypothetical protein
LGPNLANIRESIDRDLLHKTALDSSPDTRHGPRIRHILTLHQSLSHDLSNSIADAPKPPQTVVTNELKSSPVSTGGLVQPFILRHIDALDIDVLDVHHHAQRLKSRQRDVPMRSGAQDIPTRHRR